MRSNAAAAAALPTMTVLLAGCGRGGAPAADPGLGSKPSVSLAAKPARLADRPPAEILRRAEAALRDAGTLRVKASDADVELNRRGAKGWLLGEGPKAQVIYLDGRLYLKGRAFWQAHDRHAAALFGDRWVHVGGGPAPRSALGKGAGGWTQLLTSGGSPTSSTRSSSARAGSPGLSRWSSPASRWPS